MTHGPIQSSDSVEVDRLIYVADGGLKKRARHWWSLGIAINRYHGLKEQLHAVTQLGSIGSPAADKYIRQLTLHELKCTGEYWDETYDPACPGSFKETYNVVYPNAKGALSRALEHEVGYTQSLPENKAGNVVRSALKKVTERAIAAGKLRQAAKLNLDADEYNTARQLYLRLLDDLEARGMVGEAVQVAKEARIPALPIDLQRSAEEKWNWPKLQWVTCLLSERVLAMVEAQGTVDEVVQSARELGVFRFDDDERMYRDSAAAERAGDFVKAVDSLCSLSHLIGHGDWQQARKKRLWKQAYQQLDELGRFEEAARAALDAGLEGARDIADKLYLKALEQAEAKVAKCDVVRIAEWAQSPEVLSRAADILEKWGQYEDAASLAAKITEETHSARAYELILRAIGQIERSGQPRKSAELAEKFAFNYSRLRSLSLEKFAFNNSHLRSLYLEAARLYETIGEVDKTAQLRSRCNS